MKKLLVTGASGLVGSQILHQTAGQFDTLGVFQSFRPLHLPGRLERVDLVDASAVRSLLDRFQPDLIIHCAALADSDRCQREPEQVRCLNVEATATLARTARQLGARLTFISTDLVFDGRKGSSYVEDDPPHPLGIYARSKVDAEAAVRAEAGPWLILRTSLIAGPSPRGDHSLDEKLGRALRQGGPVKLFVDEFRCPIHVVDLASAILELTDSAQTGVFHLTGSERMSRHQIGLALAGHFGWPTKAIEAHSIRELPMDPPRPSDLTMANGKAQAVLKTRLRGLTEALRATTSAASAGSPRVG